MTPEELMKPRYRIIADFPGNQLSEGDIICRERIRFCDNEVYNLSDFPKVYQPLQWWEERKIEEMPEYLNCPSKKKFFKVERWYKSYFIIDGRQKMQYGNYIPATREEYEQYKQKEATNE